MAKKLLVGVVLAGLVASAGWAAAPSNSPSLIATPPQPAWSELTVQQKIVLAPLSDDWDSLESFRRKKWLGIAARFFSMNPEEQRRIQRQMQEWGKLTPEERQMARENFRTASQLPTEKKKELIQKWEEYSSLPEEEKNKYKEQAAGKPASPLGKAAEKPSALPVAPLPASPLLKPREMPAPPAEAAGTTSE